MDHRAWKDTCGIIGVFNHPAAAKIAYLGLYAMQHRGQEGAGIVVSDGARLISHRGLGLVADIFNKKVLPQLNGSAAVGHALYPTDGKTLIRNVQPFAANSDQNALVAAINGNLINSNELRKTLTDQGAIFQSSTDAETIIHLSIRSKGEIGEKIASALKRVTGGYSLILLTKNELIAARDPSGYRPLVLGRMDNSIIIASETCALDLVDAKYEREIGPGELFVVNNDGQRSIWPFPAAAPRPCAFEHIYFARPDSVVFGRNVYEVRKALGRKLALEQPIGADVVVPVPDSGVPAALGYAQESHVSFDFGLIRNHYVRQRTLSEPRVRIRGLGTRIKLNAQPSVLNDKRVAVVDDSIVRGGTSKKVINLIRLAGAKEVHMRVSSPPIVSSCLYGVESPRQDQLIASERTLEKIRLEIGADSLGFLSLAGLHSVLGEDVSQKSGFCADCFTSRNG